MSTQSAEETTEAHEFAVGDEVEFVGYEKLAAGEAPIYNEGDRLKIIGQTDPQTWGTELIRDPKIKDSVFGTEIKPVESTTETAVKDKPTAKAPVKAPAKKAEAPKEAAPTKAAPKIVKSAPKKAAAAPPTEEAKTKGKAAKPPKAEAPAATEEVLEILPTTSYSDDVQKMIKSPASALKNAVAVCTKIGEGFYTLGGLLSFIRRTKAYLQVKDLEGNSIYDTKFGFAKYAKQELGFEYRMAMYFIQIHEAFAPLPGIDEARLLKIGWAKVKELCGVVDTKNVQDWLKKAEETPREDLIAEIKSLQVAAGATPAQRPAPGQTALMTTFKFRLFEDQAGVVLEALNQAKAAVNSEDDNVGLHHLATEWLSLQSGDASSVPIDEAFKILENRYSVTDVAKYAKRYKA